MGIEPTTSRFTVTLCAAAPRLASKLIMTKHTVSIKDHFLLFYIKIKADLTFLAVFDIHR